MRKCCPRKLVSREICDTSLSTRGLSLIALQRSRFQRIVYSSPAPESTYSKIALGICCFAAAAKSSRERKSSRPAGGCGTVRCEVILVESITIERQCVIQDDKLLNAVSSSRD